MIHLLSQVVKEEFHGHQLTVQLDEGFRRSSRKKISVYSNGRKNNFGKLLEIIDLYLPKIYEITDDESSADISNSNRKELLCWYIDVDRKFTLKENLPIASKYSITDEDIQASNLWISKPSHPWVGSGNYIMIGTKKKVQSRPKVIFNREPLKWVVQPLLTNVILWFDRFKFDIRTFAVVYNVGDQFHGACYRMGICRRSVNEHDPVKDPMSAITNISVQETIPGYDHEFHMPMVYDDLRIGCDILEDLIKNSGLKRDHRKSIQFLILGLDIIFLKNDRGWAPKLIEVNEGPHIEIGYEIKSENNEKMVSTGFVLGAFGHILPNLIEGKGIQELEDWDFCSTE